MSYLWLSALCLVMSCNFVRLQERYIERSIRNSDLTMKKVQLGPDQISYWEGGQGPTLVLLHGFGADATWGWSAQIPTLAKHFHLVVPDLLWFGDSTSTQLDFTIEHQARAVKKLLAHVGVDHFDVMGISYGGILSLLLMAELPHQVDRVVVVSSPGPVYTFKDYQGLLKRFAVESASEIVMPTTPEGLERLLQLAYKEPPYVPFFARGDVIDFVKDTPGGERTALINHLVLDLENLKKKVAQPKDKILIIWGSDDSLFPVEIAFRLQKYFGSKAELKILKGARHAPNIEFGAEFNKAVMDFLCPKN